MALDRLQPLIDAEGTTAPEGLLARWTGAGTSAGWEPEPDYGAFVDDEGRVVLGAEEPRGWLTSEDPRSLRLQPSLEARLPLGAAVYFLDWGRQPLSWEELFELWSAWESQGMVHDCGPAAVPWGTENRWTAPGWVVFLEGFDGAPLSLVPAAGRTVRLSPPPSPAEAAAPPEARGALAGTLEAGESFLARARRLRGEALVPEPPESRNPGLPEDEGERLPMLPFTLESLDNPDHRWPVGAA